MVSANTQAGDGHQQAIDSHAHSSGRRHTVLESPQELLVDRHRLDITAGCELGLLDEALALDHGVHELGVPRSPVRNRGCTGPTSPRRPRSSGVHGPGATCRRGSPSRTSGERDRPSRSAPTAPRRACHGWLARQVDVVLLGERDQVFDRVLRGDGATRGGGERLVHRDAVPLATQLVLGAVGPGHGRGPGDRDRRVLHELLRERGHLVVVAVCLVGLQHRELGLCVESAPSLRKLRLIS